MPVTVIRQLQPRGRTSTSRPLTDPGKPAPGRPVGPVRRVLVLVGAALVLAGVLACGVLVHQLWWLDVAAADHSEDLIASIRHDFSSESAELYGPGNASNGPADLAEDPFVAAPVHESPARSGAAIVHLPTIGEVQPVLEGIGADVLDQGVLGHYPGSASPGEPGNFAVAGHRTTYGRPLWALDQLGPGDPVVVETATSFLVYVVRSLDVVDPDDASVLAPVPGRPGSATDGAWMVLTTCHPRFSAAERLVAVAELARTVQREEGAPTEMST